MKIFSNDKFILFILFIIALCMGAAAFYVIFTHHLWAVYVDEQAHLNLARMVTDSLTPGLSQLGFWPPLLHIILAPFASFDFLYKTGFAAPLAVFPFLLMAGFFTYKIIYALTKKRYFAFIGTFLLIGNPYILYYSLTPMMETPFMAFSLMALFFIIKWYEEKRFIYMLFGALTVSIATLARFEAFAFIPGLILLFLLGNGAAKTDTNSAPHQKNAQLQLIAPLLLCGIAFIFIYGYVYAGNPLEFLNGQSSALSQQKYVDLPAKYNLNLTIQSLLSALFYMMGSWLIIIILFCAGGFALFAKIRDKKTLMSAFFSFLPAGFVLFSLFMGHTIIYTPEIPPFRDLFNERYGLVLIPPLIIWGMFGISRFQDFFKTKMVNIVFAGTWFLMIVLMGVTFLFYLTELKGSFYAVQLATSNISQWNIEQKKIADELCAGTDRGYTLITRSAFNNIFLLNCGFSKNLIHESNSPYYRIANERPWFFIEYLVLLKPNNEDFTLNSDKVSKTWYGNKLLPVFYESVFETNYIELYKLKPDEARLYASYFQLNQNSITTLNNNMPFNIDVYKQNNMSGATELVSRDDEYYKWRAALDNF